MTSEIFFKEARRLNTKLTLSADAPTLSHSLDNEALFQLPFLAMTILAMAKGTSKPQLPEIGQFVELHRSLTRVFHRILTHPLCEQKVLTMWISSWFSPF